MPTTLEELVQPVTAEEAKALVLETLQGIGPVQQIGTGSGVVVPSGSPLNNYDVEIEITTSGTPGAAAFRYTLDGGATFSSIFTIPIGGNFSTVGTGLNFSFAGNFTTGDVYLFQTVFPPFPVTDWESGSAGRTLVEADATTLADLAGNVLADIARGGFVGYASGDWLTLLSAQQYLNDRYEAGATVGLVVLTLAAAAPSVSVAAGELVVANSTGTGSGVVQFSNTDAVSITPGTTVVAIFQAQQAGSAYNVSNGVLTVLKTPKPGLTCNNPAPGTSSVSHSGPGTGTVTPSGTPTGNFAVVARITTSGGLGVGAVQFSTDGGSNYASPLTIPGGGTYPLPMLDGVTSTGLTITFSGTFTSGDTYSFTSYASWITTPGRNTETDPSLQGRDTAQWSALGIGGGTVATFDWLCRNAPNGGSEVTKTDVEVDEDIGGRVNITVAGANGPVSTAALAAITSFVRARVGITISALVSNSSSYTLAVTAQVFTTAQQLAAVQAAISAAFLTLATETDIGGTVYWSDIEDALDQEQAGVRNVYLTVPTPNTDTDLPDHNVVLFDLAGVSYVLI